MAQHEISIILRAKNAMAAGLSEAGKQLSEFGESALRIGKAFAMAFLAAGTAVAGFAAKALQAYSVQESSEKSLASALRAHGDEVENNMALMTASAAAIQDETGAADENLIARMARLRMLGVESGKLVEATKATLALKSAGMEEAAAIKAVAMAQSGNFEMLNRYIPALRNATDETQKAAIVNDFLTRGYQQQKDQLNTVGGQWAALKGRVGDVWEEFGKAIAQNDLLKNALQRAGDAVKAFGAKVAEWVAGAGMVNMIATFKQFFENIRHGFLMTGNSAHIGFAAVADGAETAINFVIETFKRMGAVAVAVFNAIRNPSREAFGDIRKAAMTVVEGVEIVTRRTDAAMQVRDGLEKEHAANVEKINAAHVQKLNSIGEKRVADNTVVLEKIAVAEANNAEEIEKLEKKKQDAINKTADLEEKRIEEEKKLRKEALQQEIDGLEKAKAEREKIAAKRVKDFIDEAKQKRNNDKELEREAAKAARLENTLKAGGKLGKGQQEWLDAFRKINEAKQGIANPNDPINQQLAIARDNLQQAQDDGRKLNDIIAELQIANADQKRIADSLDNLLVFA